MPELFSLALPLLFLLAIVGYVLRGRRPSFRPGMANATFRSAQGPLAAVWLALVAGTWGLFDLAGKGWLPLPPSVLVTALIAVVAGLVLAQRATVFVLAVLGLIAQVAGIAVDHGLVAALLVLVVTGLVTWLFGATRGLLSPRAGAGKLLVAGLLLVVVFQVVGAR